MLETSFFGAYKEKSINIKEADTRIPAHRPCQNPEYRTPDEDFRCTRVARTLHWIALSVAAHQWTESLLNELAQS